MRLYFACALLAGCGFQHGLLGGSPAADATLGHDDDAAVVDSRPIDARPLDAFEFLDAPPVTVRQDCLDWYQHGVTTDGLQMIDPDGAGAGAPYQAWCDMTTDGGGWTLVWVYGFANYGNFGSGTNAVTPRPTWGGPAGTPTSTTIPTSPTTQGALTYSSWASLGTNFLFESNITHWFACAPGTGSLVTNTTGSLTCSVQKVLTGLACGTIAPDRMGTINSDIALWDGSMTNAGLQIYWEGSITTGNWPTHDPCAGNAQNQKTGVAGPYGSIYLRRP